MMQLALLTLGLALAPAQTGSTATLSLPMEAHVTGREILIGEICDVRSADPELAARIEQASLGYAPSPGYSRLLFNYRIEEQIERQFEGLDLTVTGERSVRVWPKTEAVEEDELRLAVESAVRVALDGRDVELAFVGVPPTLEIPAGGSAPRLEPRVIEANLRPGIIEVPVDVFVDEARYRTLRTQVELIEWNLVPVLKRDLPPGANLSAVDFEMARIRATAAHNSTPLTIQMAHGSIASRGLRKGEPVRDIDVHRPLAIVLGQAVSIEVRRGAVRARSMGVALDSGSIGGRIGVRLLDSGREMQGVIQSRDNVIVDLGEPVQFPTR